MRGATAVMPPDELEMPSQNWPTSMTSWRKSWGSPSRPGRTKRSRPSPVRRRAQNCWSCCGGWETRRRRWCNSASLGFASARASGPSPRSHTCLARKLACRAIASVVSTPPDRAIGLATFRSSAVDLINTHPTIEFVREKALSSPRSLRPAILGGPGPLASLAEGAHAALELCGALRDVAPPRHMAKRRVRPSQRRTAHVTPLVAP